MRFDISNGIDCYIHDFVAVSAFFFNAFVTAHATDYEETILRNRANVPLNDPREFFNQIFNPVVDVGPAALDSFAQLVQKLIALPRQQYRGAIAAIRCYVAATNAVQKDAGLTYSLMVAAVESLMQKFDGFDASWKDYDETKRKKIDEALEGADADTRDRVQKAILDIEHVAAGKRFRDFIQFHLSDDFFRFCPEGAPRRVGKYELPGALRNAYSIRSQYLHQLGALPNGLRVRHSFREIVYDGRVPYLTHQGFARLARHVIITFVQRGEKLEKEPYYYLREQPNVSTAMLDEQYWVGKPLTSGDGIKSRFEGLVTQYVRGCFGTATAVSDMRQVMGDIRRLYPQVKCRNSDLI